MKQPNTVELINHTGGDRTHALAAWASTGTEITEETEQRIPALLEMLARNGHGTPFEHSLLSFRVQSDIASHIHFLKHRAGVSVNSESARYKELRRDSFYVPADWPQDLQEQAEDIIQKQQDIYHLIIQALCESGIHRSRAKESARFLLPYAQQLRYVVTMNFRSFVHFQRLRNSPQAQLEIREIAQQMLELVQALPEFKHSLRAHGLIQ